MIAPGDRCEARKDDHGNVPPSVVTVLRVFPEQLILTEDAGFIWIDCEVIDAGEVIWIGHTDRLRKLPPDDGLEAASWDEHLWHPDTHRASA